MRTINKGVFIATSILRLPRTIQIIVGSNEPAVNAPPRPGRREAASASPLALNAHQHRRIDQSCRRRQYSGQLHSSSAGHSAAQGGMEGVTLPALLLDPGGVVAQLDHRTDAAGRIAAAGDTATRSAAINARFFIGAFHQWCLATRASRCRPGASCYQRVCPHSVLSPRGGARSSGVGAGQVCRMVGTARQMT